MHIYRIRAWQGATLLLSTIALMADIQVIHFSSVKWIHHRSRFRHKYNGSLGWTRTYYGWRDVMDCPGSSGGYKSRICGRPGYSQNTFFVTAKRGWLSGAGATWATTDGGQAWQILQPGRIFAITFSGNAGWMALGDDRTVRNLRTEDLGRRWTTCGKQWEKSRIAPYIGDPSSTTKTAGSQLQSMTGFSGRLPEGLRGRWMAGARGM